MTVRPVTASEYINSLNPVDAMNFVHWANHYALPKCAELTHEILTSGKSLEKTNALLEEMIEILEGIQDDCACAIQVGDWFMKESKNHIVMVSEEDDEIVVTYDNENDWINIPASKKADK